MKAHTTADSDQILKCHHGQARRRRRKGEKAGSKFYLQILLVFIVMLESTYVCSSLLRTFRHSLGDFQILCPCPMATNCQDWLRQDLVYYATLHAPGQATRSGTTVQWRGTSRADLIGIGSELHQCSLPPSYCYLSTRNKPSEAKSPLIVSF